MRKFKKGDKVVYLENDMDTNGRYWAEKSRLVKGMSYTVLGVVGTYSLQIKKSGMNPSYWIAQSQFAFYKPSNEERIAKRMKELNNA